MFKTCIYVSRILTLFEEYWRWSYLRVLRYSEEWVSHVVIMSIVNSFGGVLPIDIHFVKNV